MSKRAHHRARKIPFGELEGSLAVCKIDGGGAWQGQRAVVVEISRGREMEGVGKEDGGWVEYSMLAS